jgi:hypothetical protein
MTHFLPTGLLKQVAQAIADLPPCRLMHQLTADQVILCLLDHDIVPEAIRGDLIMNAVQDVEHEAEMQQSRAEIVFDQQAA